MKTTATLFTVLLISTIAIGQTIPNNSFETWDPGALPLTESVRGWDDLGGGGLTKVGSAQNGSFAASLKPVSLFGATFPGLLTGKFATSGTRSQYLNGYFKRTGPANVDTLLVGIAYSIGDDDSNYIAFGAQYTKRASAGWTPFSIPMYVGRPSVTADSFQIVILTPETNTAAYILDNLSLSNTAIGQPLGEDYLVSNRRLLKGKSSTLAVSLYPVPATTVLNVVIAKQNFAEARLDVLDLSGRVVKTERKRGILGAMTLNIADLQPGIYLLKTTVGAAVAVKKFVVSK
jgi:hypothetical protein